MVYVKYEVLDEDPNVVELKQKKGEKHNTNNIYNVCIIYYIFTLYIDKVHNRQTDR